LEAAWTNSPVMSPALFQKWLVDTCYFGSSITQWEGDVQCIHVYHFHIWFPCRSRSMSFLPKSWARNGSSCRQWSYNQSVWRLQNSEVLEDNSYWVKELCCYNLQAEDFSFLEWTACILYQHVKSGKETWIFDRMIWLITVSTQGGSDIIICDHMHCMCVCLRCLELVIVSASDLDVLDTFRIRFSWTLYIHMDT